MDVQSYRVDGERVTFTTGGGALRTVPRSHVDFAATARANESAGDGGAQTRRSAAGNVLPEGELLVAEIYSEHADHPHWNSRIGVYFQFRDGRYEVVGIERSSSQPGGLIELSDTDEMP